MACIWVDKRSTDKATLDYWFHSECAGEVRDGERGERSRFICVGHSK